MHVCAEFRAWLTAIPPTQVPLFLFLILFATVPVCIVLISPDNFTLNITYMHTYTNSYINLVLQYNSNLQHVLTAWLPVLPTR